jgi:hypothetical protein
MGHYKIRKDADTDRWYAQFKDNDPIAHHSFREALDSVLWLLHLSRLRHVTKRGHK